MVTKKEVWKSWVDEYINILDPVPLFDSNSNGRVQTKEYGKNDRPILERSPEMTEEMREGRKVVIRNLNYFWEGMNEGSGEADEGLLSRFF